MRNATRHHRDASSPGTAARVWRWAVLALLLCAVLVVAALYFLAGPVWFLLGVLALVPFCAILSLVENRLTEGSWIPS